MRSKLNLSLWVLLVVQVVLVAVMYTGNDNAAAVPAQPWLQLDGHDLTQVVISDGDGNQVKLKHADNGWIVPARSGFPVEQQRLQQLLGNLDTARPGLPVAMSGQARTRFHVGKESFERHLLFKTRQGVAADLYLGKRAGAGRVYARLADQDAIQNVRLSLWQASADATDWLDKAFLHLDMAQQQQIELPHVTLIHADQLWRPKALSDDRLPDPDKIAALVQRLQNLRWNKLLGTTANVALASQPTFVVTVTPKKGEPVTYRFYQQPAPAATDAAAEQSGTDDGDDDNAKPDWRVTRSNADFVVTLRDAVVEPLRQANTHRLSMAKQATKGDHDGADGRSDPTGHAPGKAGDE